MPNVRFKVRTQRRPAQFSRVAIASQKDNRIETCTVGPHFFETMCPTAFLAPTLTAKTCFICAQPQNAFFWPNLRCKVIDPMAKSRSLVVFPAQKKEPKWFQNLGRFQKEFFCSAA